jgi:hypothetical protein
VGGEREEVEEDRKVVRAGLRVDICPPYIRQELGGDIEAVQARRGPRMMIGIPSPGGVLGSIDVREMVNRRNALHAGRHSLLARPVEGTIGAGTVHLPDRGEVPVSSQDLGEGRG